MPEVFFAIPGDLETRTGGTVYDRRVLEELRALGWVVRHLPWSGSFPFASAAAVRDAQASLAACPDGALALIDGLAFGVLPELIATEAKRLRIAALVHHPLALETGLQAADQARFRISERAALASAHGVIVTSSNTAATLRSDYDVPGDRITIARPGVDRDDALRPQRAENDVPQLLTIATVTPRKAHDVLIAALSRIADLDWRCTIAGSLERAPDTADAILRQVETEGLSGRILFVGEITDPSRLYRSADIFVLPSRYEGYGMVFAEALAQGLPIVATAVGAVPDVVPPSAGILVPVDDPDSLAAALRLLITEPDERVRLASGARAAARSLPGWRETALGVADALLRLQHGR